MGNYHVVCVNRRGVARMVMIRKGQTSTLATSFTRYEAFAADRSGDLNARQAAQALKWAKRKNLRAMLYKPGQHPFLTLGQGTAWPTNEALVRKLSRVARRARRRAVIVSGLRTSRRAWELRMDFLNGTGNLAALCCTKYTGKHSWEACGRNPQSNHCSGNAADVALVMNKDRWIDIGDLSRARKWMRRFGLCLPVGPPEASQAEPWHVQVGTVFRA